MNGKGSIIKGAFSGALSKFKMWSAGLVGTKAGVSLGVPAGQIVALDVDAAPPVNYLKFSAGGVRFYVTGANRFTLGGASFVSMEPIFPSADGTLDLGAIGGRWRDLYIASDVHISDGGKLNLEGSAGDTYIRRNGAQMELYLDAGAGLIITPSSLSCYKSTNPGADDLYQLGTSSRRWNHIRASQTIHLDDGAGVCITGMRYVGSGDAWMMAPKMTTAQKNAMSGAWGAAEQGRFVFDTTIPGMSYWNGAAWVNW